MCGRTDQLQLLAVVDDCSPKRPQRCGSQAVYSKRFLCGGATGKKGHDQKRQEKTERRNRTCCHVHKVTEEFTAGLMLFQQNCTIFLQAIHSPAAFIFCHPVELLQKKGQAKRTGHGLYSVRCFLDGDTCSRYKKRTTTFAPVHGNNLIACFAKG